MSLKNDKLVDNYYKIVVFLLFYAKCDLHFWYKI